MLDGKGRFNEAIQQFQEAIRLSPHPAPAHNNLASIFLRQGRYDEAIGQLRTAVRLQPDYECFLNLGQALAEAADARQDTNELAEAVSNFQQALQLRPQSSQAQEGLGKAWTRLGFLCARQNNMPGAEQAFGELMRLQPNNADACCWLGNTLAMQNKPAEAVALFLKALQLNPGDDRAEFNLARALSSQGKRQEAAEHCRKALKINPNFVDAQNALRALESPAGRNP
jgi:tetratricopeptide (TPR) repeat protein